MTGTVQQLLSLATPQTLFYDAFTGSGPTSSHVPDKSMLAAGVYNIDGADFNTNLLGGRLSYEYQSGTSDYGVASYGESGKVFSTQRKFVLSATVNLGSYSGLSYQSVYVLARRNSGVYGMTLNGSDVTLYGVDSGTYTTSLVLIDNQDTSLIMTYNETDVRFQFGPVDFSRPRQAAASPVSDDYLTGFYILLAAGPCTVDDLRLTEQLP